MAGVLVQRGYQSVYPGTHHQTLVHARNTRRVPLASTKYVRNTQLAAFSTPTLPKRKASRGGRATAPPRAAASVVPPLLASTAANSYANILPGLQNIVMYIAGCALLMYAFNTVFNKMLGVRVYGVLGNAW